MKGLKRLLIALALIAAVISITACSDDPPPEDNTVSIVANDGGSFVSDYVIIFGSTDGASKIASTLCNEILYAKYGITPDFAHFSLQNPSENEILIGVTDRAESVQFISAIDAQYPADEYYAWGYSMSGTKLILYANSKVYSTERLYEMLLTLMDDEGFALSDGSSAVCYKSIKELEDEKKAEEEANKNAALANRLEAAKAMNDAFLHPTSGNYLTLFGGSYTTSLSAKAGKTYPTPETLPKSAEHPRVNVNADMMDDIESALKNTQFLATYTKLWILADTEFYGIFPEVSAELTYNYGDGSNLAIIEAKAFAYLITGEQAYAYEAIVGVKNAMLTMVTNKDQFIDPFRAYGYLMLVAAETYDWCYDVMTRADMEQFVAGIEHLVCRWDPNNGIYNMEIGFPPTRLNGVNGHGTSVMLMRDYLAFSAAIYDEFPDWWNFCAGRFYAEFIDAFDTYFKSGMIHQGTACYAPNKLYTYLWSCWIIETLGGERPFKNDIDLVCLSLLGHMMPNRKLFPTGDGASGRGVTAGISYQCCLMSAALFKDEACQYWGKEYSKNYSSFVCSVSANQWSPVMGMIFLANGVEITDSSANAMPLVQYNCEPLSQLIVRNSWEDNAAAVFMKIGTLNAGNHEHQDSGTFQIYYKGLLATTSGIYNEYGTQHWRYYHQATVSKCGILVFDPDKYAPAEFDASGNVTNPDKAFYTGSQMASNFNVVGKETGVSYGYTGDGGVKYAYIAGDYTNAYDSTTVDLVERRMLTVYTGNEDYPMFFFVFDGISSDKEKSVKKFLLQTPTEPTVSDADGDGISDTVSVTAESGKLVLTSLLGNGSIEAIGGTRNNYNINGVQLDPKGYEDVDLPGSTWGRVEISTTGSKEDKLLNVMYVTDADNSAALSPTLIETSIVAGAQLESTVAAFVKDNIRIAEAFEFESEGEGNITYYISGVEHGTWNISVDGVPVCQAACNESEGIITFEAPAGRVTVAPGADIVQPGYSKIRYVLERGELSSNAPLQYKEGEELELTATVELDGYIFIGWYLDAKFTTPITKIDASSTGTVTLYARLSGPTEMHGSFTAIQNRGGLSPSPYGDLLNASDDKRITLELKPTVITDPNHPYTDRAHIRIRDGARSSETIVLWFMGDKVYAYDKSTVLTTLDRGDVIGIVLDFDDNTINYYVNGNHIAAATATGVTNLAEDASGGYDRYNCASGYYFWQFDQQPSWNGSVLKIDSLAVYAFDLYAR